MTDVRLNAAGLPDDVPQKLFQAWVQALSAQDLNLTQRSTGSVSEGATVRRSLTIGDPGGDHFTLTESGVEISLDEVVGVTETSVRSILARAAQAVAAQDFGPGVVYRGQYDH